jgi:NADH-quinone oxidoreductase subunit N
MLWTVAILTMVVGTVVALVQTDVKRMLAYSSIAHAGFVLVGVLAFSTEGIASVLFYLVVYGLATIGAFAVVTLVRQTRTGAEGTVILGEATHLAQWAGLGRRSPWLAGALSLFLLSFAGIPLTAGFAGKFTVFTAAADGGAVPLVVVGVIASAAAVFFYVRLIVLMYFTPEREEEGEEGVTVVTSSGFTTVVIAVAAIGTVLLGVLPGPLLELLGQAVKFLP